MIARSALGPKGDAGYRASLVQAEAAGAKVLERGGSALDAVEAAINVLEDDPLFNAGRGAVFTAEGRNELDSSIMDGSNLKAGAVAGVTRTRHPISLARAVMEKSPYVMLAGAGADAFGARVGLEQVDPSFFFTEARWQSLVKQLRKEGLPVPPRPVGAPPPPAGPGVPVAQIDESAESHVHGTTGVVALDRAGNIAAGTSTGGLQAKMPGRVGDSPIIGAGTYASNQSCAVSACTGTAASSLSLPTGKWCGASIHLGCSARGRRRAASWRLGFIATSREACATWQKPEFSLNYRAWDSPFACPFCLVMLLIPGMIA